MFCILVQMMIVRFSIKRDILNLTRQKTWPPWKIFGSDWLEFNKSVPHKTTFPNDFHHSTNDVCEAHYKNALFNLDPVKKTWPSLTYSCI